MEKHKAVAAAARETVRRSDLERLPTLHKLEIFSACIIAIIAVYWIINGDPALGALIGSVALLLAYSVASQKCPRLWSPPHPAIYYVIGATIIIGIHRHGLPAALWAIPLALATFYVFSFKQAFCFNLACLATVLVQTYISQDYALGFRIAGALLVSSLLTHFFSTLINQQKRDLAQLSIIDPLTGTFNRLYLQQHLNKIIQQANGVHTLVLIDVNNFKQINTQYGHDGGDKALIKMIEVFNAYTSPNTPIYRYGGDEFIIVYENTTIAEAKHHVELVTAALRKISRQPHNIPISFSAGYASTANHKTTEEILTACDKSMFAQKTNKSQLFQSPNGTKR